MANQTLNSKIVHRSDTATNWSTANPVLLVGELGYESDTGRIKIGDGTTVWNNLSYIEYVSKSGDTMSGDLIIEKTTPNLSLSNGTTSGNIRYNSTDKCIEFVFD